MNIYQIVATGIIATVLALAIKKQSPELSLMISIITSILIFIMIIPRISAVLEILDNLAQSVSANLPYISSVLKVIGVAYIAQFGAQICSDCGESAIASKIELAGKIIIMTISAPILMTLLNLVVTMLP